MLNDHDHPTVPLSDWQTFKTEFSRHRFQDVIDRSEIALPEWFMPSTWGAVVPSAQIMKPISWHRVRPAYWSEIAPGVFREGRGLLCMTVIRFGAFWSIVNWSSNPAALAFHFGSTPVLLRTYRDAMWLRRHLLKNQVANALGYRWIPILPNDPDIAAVQALAAYKGSLELADQMFWSSYDARRRSTSPTTA